MTVEDQHRAVDVICDGWPRVLNSRHQNLLRARRYDGPVITASGYFDPTGDTVASSGHAEWWERELRIVLKPFELNATNPNTLRRDWHRLFNEHPTGWSEQALGGMYRLADMTLRWFPRPEPRPQQGEQVGSVTVGDGRRSSNETEECAVCHKPLPAVRGVRRFVPDPYGGGDWVCKSPCWYQLTTSRGIHPRQRAKQDQRQ